MRYSLTQGIVLLAFLVPTGAMAQDMSVADEVVLSPIYVKDVDHAWVDARAAMNEWKSEWVGAQGTPEFVAAQRAFVSKLERDHRIQYYPAKPVTVPVVTPPVMPAPTPVTVPSVPSSILRGTGRASLFMIQPKLSARTIRENVLLQRSKND